ncbi:MAG: glycosyltransferase family 39 protein [Candidatus Levybacteria bacterium]|nr:glycosyltransferase family 39 protein [Candidatus Levybacteria bacterium]
MRLLERLEKSKNFWFLLIIWVVFFFLRFPSLFEPYWYGDEGIYQTLGLGIDNGRLLYRDIFDNKPPFLYLLYGLFGADQFMLRLTSLIFGVLTLGVFFKLCKKLLENDKASYVATITFAFLFGLPLIEGNIANAENFMLFFNIAAGFLVVRSLDHTNSKRYKVLFLAGLTLGISFLFKIVGGFDFAAFLVFLFFANFAKNFRDIFKPQNILSEIKNISPLIIGFCLPILLVTLYFVLNGAFPYFIKATFANNIGYVGYGNKFIIPQGLLILKLAIVALSLSFLFIKRKVLGNNQIFIFIWLVFSLFNAFFSQRPYTHYVLVAIPALCLLIGLVMLKNKFFKFSLLVLIVTLFLLITNFSFYIKTVFYYQNFVQFLANQKNVYQYQRFFDGNTPNDYELASYINRVAGEKDNIFIWGNNAQVYKLTNKLPPGRYTVAYHITSYEDGMSNTLEGLKKAKPKLIIIMGNVAKFPFAIPQYLHKMNINGVDIYEKIL